MKTVLKILNILILLLYSHSLHAKSGVATIIEKDMSENSAFTETYDPSDKSTWLGDYNYTPDLTNSSLDINLSYTNMKAAINDSLGLPEGNYLILILFSLAALLQMARVTSGSGDWTAFVIRLIVILGFLRCYSILFDGLEVFFAHISDNILSGESALDTFWFNGKSTIESLFKSTVSNKNLFDYDFFKNGLIFGTTYLSGIVSYALYTLIFLIQSCLLITLRYFGPIVISLAIIPETDFTSGYITTTFQTLSWSVVAAILIKILSTTTNVSLNNQLNMADLVSITSMNITYSLAFLFVPIMTGMILSGRGLGGISAALISTGFGFASKGVSYFTNTLTNKSTSFKSNLSNTNNNNVGKNGLSNSSFKQKSPNGIKFQNLSKPKSSHTMEPVNKGIPSGRTKISTNRNSKYDV